MTTENRTLNQLMDMDSWDGLNDAEVRTLVEHLTEKAADERERKVRLEYIEADISISRQATKEICERNRELLKSIARDVPEMKTCEFETLDFDRIAEEAAR